MLNREAKINVRPNDSREEDFSLSLAEYFLMELKANDINASRSQACVKIKLSGAYDGFDHIVIDCVDGRLYLRSNERDRYFGRLSKFTQRRRADAYTCLSYNATRIINRIKNLDQTIIEANAVDHRFNDKVAYTVRDERTGCVHVFTQPLTVADTRERQAIVVDVAPGDVRSYVAPSRTANVVISASDVRAYTPTIVVNHDDVRVLPANDVIVIGGLVATDLRGEFREPEKQAITASTVLNDVGQKLRCVVGRLLSRAKVIFNGGAA